MKKTILVAAHALVGADGTIEPGTEITTEVREALDLDDREVERLRETGALHEVIARGSDDGAELAAANARADAAEARVAELEKQLAAAKPTAQRGG